MSTGEVKFERVLNKRDIFAISFGAMIGWAWVVLAGEWVLNAGTMGAIAAFLFGGLMVFFMGLTYAELTSAMPQCGGEHVFSHRALGKNASFVCTWAIILGYVSVVAFEACAFPTVIQYIIPDFMQGYMYTVAGFDVYASWVIVAVVSAAIITGVNLFGTKPAAFLQSVLTVGIAIVGITLMAGAALTGTEANMFPLFDNGMGGILKVAIMTPFMFVGFDVIPQAAEEINVPFKKIGKIMLFSIALAVGWYLLIILAVGSLMSKEAMLDSTIVTADAMKVAFDSTAMANVVIIGGMAAIITSWNSFFLGGSRAIYALAESKMLPKFLTKMHPKFHTPINAILLIGIISCLAPFFGRKAMVWLVDAGSFGVVVAYFIVALSFLVLRKTEPDMPRPYKVPAGRFVGAMAVILSGIMAMLYIVPAFPSALVAQEWLMVGVWGGLGMVYYAHARKTYGEEFGQHEVRTFKDVTESSL